MTDKERKRRKEREREGKAGAREKERWKGEKPWLGWKSTKGQRGTYSVPFRFLHPLFLYTSIQCDDKKRARQKNEKLFESVELG